MSGGPVWKTFTVRGRVQGVGFRWWTRSQATRLGLSGTVRNRDDGSVEVRVRGEEGAVAALTELLRRGPPGAAVIAIEEAPGEAVEVGEGFQIVR